jgi:hypothetical protein
MKLKPDTYDAVFRVMVVFLITVIVIGFSEVVRDINRRLKYLEIKEIEQQWWPDSSQSLDKEI